MATLCLQIYHRKMEKDLSHGLASIGKHVGGSFRLYEAVFLVGVEVHLIISFSVHSVLHSSQTRSSLALGLEL